MLILCSEILRNYESMLEVILPSLPTTVDGMSAPEGKAAFVWILGEYGDVSVGEGVKDGREGEGCVWGKMGWASGKAFEGVSEGESGGVVVLLQLMPHPCPIPTSPLPHPCPTLPHPLDHPKQSICVGGAGVHCVRGVLRGEAPPPDGSDEAVLQASPRVPGDAGQVAGVCSRSVLSMQTF